MQLHNVLSSLTCGSTWLKAQVWTLATEDGSLVYMFVYFDALEKGKKQDEMMVKPDEFIVRRH